MICLSIDYTSRHAWYSAILLIFIFLQTHCLLFVSSCKTENRISLTSQIDIVQVLLKDGNDIEVETVETTDRVGDPKLKEWCIHECENYTLVYDNPTKNFWTLTIRDEEQIGNDALVKTIQSTCLTDNPTVSPIQARISPAPTECVNEPNWQVVEPLINCTFIESIGESGCKVFDSYRNFGKNVLEACCVCGGGDHLQVQPSLFPSSSLSSEQSFKPNVWKSNLPSKLLSSSKSPSVNPVICQDHLEWHVTNATNFELNCTHVKQVGCLPIERLGKFAGKSVRDACCLCGGGTHVSNIPTQTNQPPSIRPSLRSFSNSTLIHSLEPSYNPISSSYPDTANNYDISFFSETETATSFENEKKNTKHFENHAIKMKICLEILTFLSLLIVVV